MAQKTKYHIISEEVDVEAIKKVIQRKARAAADPKKSRKDVEKLHDERRKEVQALAKEDLDYIFSYLLDNGFAADEKSAENMMEAMSETWIAHILDESI